MTFAPGLVGTCQDSEGGEGRQCPSPSYSRNLRAIHSSKVSGLDLGAISCLIGQTLARSALDGQPFTLYVVDAQFGARIHAEIKFGQVSVEMLAADVLVNADDAALEDRKEAFKRIGVHVAAPPFVLGMVNRTVAGRAGEFEHRRAIRHQAATAVELRIEQSADAAMVDDHRADRAATLDQAKHLYVALAAIGTAAGFWRTAKFHIVGLDRLAFAANWAALVRRHGEANAVAKVPRGFESASEHTVELARADAFLAGTEKLDRLQPQVQRQMAVLKDRALAHRKGRATASVALAQPELHDAFRVSLAGLGMDARKPADLVTRSAAMRAYRAGRPKLGFDVFESGFFAEKPRIGKDRFRHDGLH
jgi:hypothetical protein